MSDKKTVVIYHANCADGFCCAWLLSKVYPDAEFVYANYGDTPPDVTGKRVIIADFSYPKAELIDLCILCDGDLTLLDHHQSALKDLSDIHVDLKYINVKHQPQIIFDMGRSGGMMVWEWLNPAPTIRTPSWLVRYTQDRDLWTWNLPDSKAVSAFLRTQPFTFDAWDNLDTMIRVCPVMWNSIVTQGNAILLAESQIVKQHVRHAVPIELDGYKGLAVNATTLMSEIGEQLALASDFGATWFVTGDGIKRWSLRSRKDGVDVSVLAKRRGGGGHKQAAGFEEVGKA